MSKSNVGKWHCCFCSQVFKKEWTMICHSTFEHGDAHHVLNIIESITDYNQNANFSFGLSNDREKDIENIKRDLIESSKPYENRKL